MSSFVSAVLSECIKDLSDKETPSDGQLELEIRFGTSTKVVTKRTSEEATSPTETSRHHQHHAQDIVCQCIDGGWQTGVPHDNNAVATIEGNLRSEAFDNISEETTKVTCLEGGIRYLQDVEGNVRCERKTQVGDPVDMMLPAYAVDIRISAAVEIPLDDIQTNMQFISQQRHHVRQRIRTVFTHEKYKGWEIHRTWVYHIIGGDCIEEEYHLEVERCDMSATGAAAVGILMALLPSSTLPLRPDYIENPYPQKCNHIMLQLCQSLPFPSGMLHKEVLRRKDLGDLRDGYHVLRPTFKESSEAILVNCQRATHEMPMLVTSDSRTWTHPRMRADHSILSRLPDCILRVEMVWCSKNAKMVAVVVDVPSYDGLYSQRMAWVADRIEKAKSQVECLNLLQPHETPIVAAKVVSPTSAWSRLISNSTKLSTHGDFELQVDGIVAHSEEGNRTLVYYTPEDLFVDLLISWDRHKRQTAWLGSLSTTDNASFASFRRHFPESINMGVGRFKYNRDRGAWVLIGASNGTPSPPSILASIREALYDHLTITEFENYFKIIEREVI